MISAATELGIGKIVTASSPTVLGYGSPAGWLPDSFPLDERTTPKPWNAYALSKLIAEQTVQMFAAAQGDEDPVRRVPALLRHLARGMGRRTHPAGPHRCRTPCRPGPVRAGAVQLRGRP